MSKRKKAEPVFKPYLQNQPYLLPPSFDELVLEGHPARIINDLIDGIDLGELYKTYKGCGSSSYEPSMLLKVLILAYTQKIYSSRRIAKEIRENVAFMWLAGANAPDFHTLAGFRSGRLKEVIDSVFGATVGVLIEGGFIELKNCFIDGTKIEADANKYSFVWKKSTETFKTRLEEQIRATIAENDRVNAEEDNALGEKDLPEFAGNGPIPSDKLRETISHLKKQVAKDVEQSAEKEKALKKIEKDHLPRLEKYEQQLEIAGERGSYSKTDHDATFMGMKEDPMRNHQLKPAYSVQMGTENQFIVGFSVHQSPTDTGLLIPCLENMGKTNGALPEAVIADVGYGSEENYKWLEEQNIPAFVKFNTFHKEKSRKWKKNPFRKENFPYDKDQDVYRCPAGDELRFVREHQSRTKTGFLQTFRIYQAARCGECPYRDQCVSGTGCCTIQVYANLDRYRDQARVMLNSEEGSELIKRRSVEVESLWGHIKHDLLSGASYCAVLKK
jgi:transposase